MRPEPNGWPLRNTAGTAMMPRCSTSSWNSAPSIATWRTREFSTAIRFSAWTTSGQLWQLRLIQVSKRMSPSSAMIRSITSGSTLGG